MKVHKIRQVYTIIICIQIGMNKRNKWLLGFSIIFWVIVIMGIVLFAVSFQKVPLEHYGLKTSYFSPNVNSVYYLPGLYDIGVGYYFITIPSTKQYLLDRTVTVINKNMQKINVTYSLVYRLNPNQFYTLYMSIGKQYESYLIASINNIISSVFLTLQQSQSRVTVQKKAIDAINSPSNKVSLVLGSAIAVQALWINELDFPTQVQQGYQSSLSISDSYQNAYQTTHLQYQKTRIKTRAVEQTINLLHNQLKFNATQTYNKRMMQVLMTDLSAQQLRQARMSHNYLMKRIWTYYNSTKMIFYQR